MDAARQLAQRLVDEDGHSDYRFQVSAFDHRPG